MPMATVQAKNTEESHDKIGKKKSQAAPVESSEFYKFLVDFDNIFKTTNLLTGDELADTRTELIQKINAAKASIHDVGDSVATGVTKTTSFSNTYAHKKPWQLFAAGSVIGFLCGYLLTKRN